MVHIHTLLTLAPKTIMATPLKRHLTSVNHPFVLSFYNAKNTNMKHTTLPLPLKKCEAHPKQVSIISWLFLKTPSFISRFGHAFIQTWF